MLISVPGWYQGRRQSFGMDGGNRRDATTHHEMHPVQCTVRYTLKYEATIETSDVEATEKVRLALAL